jgi:hypothetical protein
MSNVFLDQYPCNCLDRCRQEGASTSQIMQAVMAGGAYCSKRRGEPFKHRPMSDMERRQLEAAQRADELAQKEWRIARDKLHEAASRKEFTAQVLNHWDAFTANPQGESHGDV